MYRQCCHLTARQMESGCTNPFFLLFLCCCETTGKSFSLDSFLSSSITLSRTILISMCPFNRLKAREDMLQLSGESVWLPKLSYTELSESVTPNDSNSQEDLSLLCKSCDSGGRLSTPRVCITRQAGGASRVQEEIGPDKTQPNFVRIPTGPEFPRRSSPVTSSQYWSALIRMSICKLAWLSEESARSVPFKWLKLIWQKDKGWQAIGSKSWELQIASAASLFHLLRPDTLSQVHRHGDVVCLIRMS